MGIQLADTFSQLINLVCSSGSGGQTHLCRLLWKPRPTHQKRAAPSFQLLCLQGKQTSALHQSEHDCIQREIFSLFKCQGWRSRSRTNADFLLQIRDNTQDPCGRLSFMKEPRNYRSLTQNAICNLNITLPSYCKVKVSGREGTGGGGVGFYLTEATF